MILLYKCTNDEIVILNKLYSLRILMRINFFSGIKKKSNINTTKITNLNCVFIYQHFYLTSNAHILYAQ